MIGDDDAGLLFVDLEEPSGANNINMCQLYEIRDIRSIMYDHGVFYILANRINI